MADPTYLDPYERTHEHIEEPPVAFGEILKRIGPGMILAASIVGSGELIATTVLGAEVGYTLLWLIIISCLIKIVVQNELGRYSIATGETALEAFDRIPGPRLKVSWMVWAWCIMALCTLMQIGAMMGAIGEIFNRQFAEVPITAWVWLLNFLTVGLLIGGRYSVVERVATILVVTFTVMTVGCTVILFMSPEYFSVAELAEGLSFHLPATGIATAVAAFGITGVGGTELVMYPYWCIEKGYARFAGPRDESPAWKRRAHGWVRVMGVDVVASMIVYTFATVAFYLLGAGVLNGMGLMPAGSQMIDTLSNLYTQTLGMWSLPIFLVGAVAVLYSTVFSSTAAHCRVFADFIGMLGFYDRRNYGLRLRMIRILVVLMLFIPSVFFMLVGDPVLMVKIGGVSQAFMLPVIGFATVYLRYKHMPTSILPKGWVTLALWVSALVMAVMMGYSIILRLVGG